MFSHANLIKLVLKHLHQFYNISIDLPDLQKNTFVSKIVMKYIGQNRMNNNTNRYEELIRTADDILEYNLINRDKIMKFSQELFEIITNDIDIIEKNQNTRYHFSKTKQEIKYRFHTIIQLQKQLEFKCCKINNKIDLLAFIETNFQQHLQSTEKLTNHFTAISNVSIYTTFKIDKLFQNSSNFGQENYLEYYQPLLEVMIKLKSTLMKLYDQLNNCESLDYPLCSVNFLMNCKNLLNQLSEFLIEDDCIFNRLIFYIVDSQKKNIKTISTLYQKKSKFIREMTSDLFKSFFTGFMFVKYYREIKNNLIDCKEHLIRLFLQISNMGNISSNNDSSFINNQNKYLKFKIKASTIEFSNILNQEQQQCELIYKKLQQLRQISCSGQNYIMLNYINRKQCKKIQMIQQQFQESKKLKNTIKNSRHYQCICLKLIDAMQKSQQCSQQVMQQIFKMKEKQKSPYAILQLQIDDQYQDEDLIENIFKRTFLLIQQHVMVNNELQFQIQNLQKKQNQLYFKQKLFPTILEQIQENHRKYFKMQVNLLNQYQKIKNQKQIVFQKGQKDRNFLLHCLQQYFFQLKLQLGSEITNEQYDTQETNVKIANIQKSQLLLQQQIKKMKNEVTQKQIKTLQKLADYKYNLEYMLQIYLDSVYEDIFQSVMKHLQFHSEQWQQNLKKVEVFIVGIQKYIQILKQLSKIGNNPNSKMQPKVHKIAQDRAQLYTTIEEIYLQCYNIYKQCKTKQHLNIQNNGVELYNQQKYKYILMLYEYKNQQRTRLLQLQQILLYPQSRNYLIDQLYEPFASQFNSYITLSEKQLLNLTLRLSHVLRLSQIQSDVLLALKNCIMSKYSEEYFSILESVCEQMVVIYHENQLVLELEQQKLYLHNFDTFKNNMENKLKYYQFAKQLLKEYHNHNIILNDKFQNKELQMYRNFILQNWKNIRKQIAEVAQQNNIQVK